MLPTVPAISAAYARKASAAAISRHRSIVGRTGRVPCATLPAMNRRTIAAAAAALILGCGPTTINVTTSGEGEESHGPDPSVGSTGIGGSETGPVDPSGSSGASSGSGSSDSSSAGGSSSTGEPPAECFFDPWIDGLFACWCGDELADPSACGCVDTIAGCECPGGNTSPRPCIVPGCFVIGGACYCDTQPADLSECHCTSGPSDGGWACSCDDFFAEPEACGCFDLESGCSCPDASSVDPCFDPATQCAVDAVTMKCSCGDPALCGCFTPQSGECWCGFDCPNGDCVEWPEETCV
jgi:hypothetical protein